MDYLTHYLPQIGDAEGMKKDLAVNWTQSAVEGVDEKDFPRENGVAYLFRETVFNKFCEGPLTVLLQMMKEFSSVFFEKLCRNSMTDFKKLTDHCRTTFSKMPDWIESGTGRANIDQLLGADVDKQVPQRELN